MKCMNKCFGAKTPRRFTPRLTYVRKFANANFTYPRRYTPFRSEDFKIVNIKNW